MSIHQRSGAKISFALASALTASTVLSGCFLSKNVGTILGGVGGAAAGKVLGGGDFSTAAGALGGAALGSRFDPNCERERSVAISRSRVGQDAGPWRGPESYSEDCEDTFWGSPQPSNLPPDIKGYAR